MRKGTDYQTVRMWAAGAGAAVSLLCLTFVMLAGAQTPTTVCPPPSPPAAEGAPTPGTAEPASEQLVACIGSQSITGATFQHWAHIARRSEGPSKHPQSMGTIVQQVMGFLISADWVLGEAQDRNIVVSETAVRHRFDHLRAQQFPKRREFKRFLEQSGQTVADLLLRVRLNMSSERLQKLAMAGHHGAHSREHALERFVHDFKAKWTAQTYCAPAYAVQDCGHVQASL